MNLHLRAAPFTRLQQAIQPLPTTRATVDYAQAGGAANVDHGDYVTPASRDAGALSSPRRVQIAALGRERSGATVTVRGRVANVRGKGNLAFLVHLFSVQEAPYTHRDTSVERSALDGLCDSHSASLLLRRRVEGAAQLPQSGLLGLGRVIG